MSDLDTLVQNTLLDRTKTPLDRAVSATVHIEQIVTAEAGLAMGTPLPIPAEWAHKVPVTPEQSHRSSVTELVAETIEGDVGVSIFSEPDEVQQSRFDRFWKLGR